MNNWGMDTYMSIHDDIIQHVFKNDENIFKVSLLIL